MAMTLGTGLSCLFERYNTWHSQKKRATTYLASALATSIGSFAFFIISSRFSFAARPALPCRRDRADDDEPSPSFSFSFSSCLEMPKNLSIGPLSAMNTSIRSCIASLKSFIGLIGSLHENERFANASVCSKNFSIGACTALTTSANSSCPTPALSLSFS